MVFSKWLNSSIRWDINKYYHSKEEVLHIPQSSRSETSTSESLVSYTGHLLVITLAILLILAEFEAQMMHHVPTAYLDLFVKILPEVSHFFLVAISCNTDISFINSNNLV